MSLGFAFEDALRHKLRTVATIAGIVAFGLLRTTVRWSAGRRARLPCAN